MPKGKFGDQGQTDQCCDYMPTPEQIAATAAQIRAGWDDTRLRRACPDLRESPVRIQHFGHGHEGFEAKGAF